MKTRHNRNTEAAGHKQHGRGEPSQGTGCSLPGKHRNSAEGSLSLAPCHDVDEIGNVGTAQRRDGCNPA